MWAPRTRRELPPRALRHRNAVRVQRERHVQSIGQGGLLLRIS